MSLLSPLMIIYADQSGELSPEQVGLSLGFAEPHIVWGGFMEAQHMLTQRQVPPQIMLVDLGASQQEVLPELERLLQAKQEHTIVVVVGNINDVSFYRALKSRGVFEYLAHPLDLNDLRGVIQENLYAAAPGETHSAPQGTVISFMSAASGDGASTIALNTAYTLANIYKKSTVLVDMDYQFGMIARHLDLNAPFGVRELFEYPDRGVDATLISKILYPYGEYLKIIPAPDELRLLPHLRPDVLRELVATLKTQFDYVIFDVPHIWSEWTASLITYSQKNVVVGQLWLRSVTHLSRLLAAWKAIGVSKESINLVINRSGAKFKEAITPQDFERVSGKSIDFYMANDIKTVVNAENQGKTIVEIYNNLLEKQIKELAQSFLTHPDTGFTNSTPKKSILSLFNK